jgi:hypothetical protein
LLVISDLAPWGRRQATAGGRFHHYVRQAAIALGVLLLPLPIYILRLDEVAGMMVDDAWYVLLGKALAEGRGYWLINSPVAGILPGYPPGFPALLSLVFRVQPGFPGNLFLLKSVSIAAMLGAGLLSYAYFRQRRLPGDIAACGAIAVTLTPALVFLATSTVMSECVFLVAQLGAVVLVHRAVDARAESAARTAVLAGLVAAATMLIRSAGVAVVAAGFLWLIKERQWKRAWMFAAVAGVCVAPWLLYSSANAPTAAQQEIHRGSIVYSYGDQVWMRRAGSTLSGRIAPRELLARIANNTADVVGRSIGGIFVPTLLRGSDESGEEVLSLGGNLGWTFVGLGGSPVNMAISAAFAAITLFGYVRAIRHRITVAEFLVPISIAITLVWPWWPFRFVLPLAPFLFYYFVEGLRPAAAPSVARVVLSTLIGLHLYDHGGYTLHARSRDPHRVDWLARYAEVDATLEWMSRHVDARDVVATTNPALVYLRTGHRTIALDTMTENWSIWRDRGARSVACLIPHALPSRSRGPYELLYESSPDLSKRAWVIAID